MDMKDVEHTHPHTNRAFGEVVFTDGEAVAADGGEADAETTDSTDTQTMEDVSHTPPHGDGANRAFERGTEGRDETV